MSKITPCLWFDGEAEADAKFYVSLLPDSRIERVQKNLVDGPAGKAGTVLVVQFTLAGQEYMALNGGTRFDIPMRSPSRSTATIRPRSIVCWTRCPPMADRSNDAAGSKTAMAYPGRSCRPRCRNCWAAGTICQDT